VEILDFEFETLGILIDGVISFEEASTYLGEPVVGHFEATVVLPP